MYVVLVSRVFESERLASLPDGLVVLVCSLSKYSFFVNIMKRSLESKRSFVEVQCIKMRILFCFDLYFDGSALDLITQKVLQLVIPLKY